MTAVSTPVDYCIVFSATIGTGPLTLAEAVPGYRGVEALADGLTYSYTLQDPVTSGFELGQGVYSAGGASLTRVSRWSSAAGNVPIACSGQQLVKFTLQAEDLAIIAVPVTATPSSADADPTRLKLVWDGSKAWLVYPNGRLQILGGLT